MIVAGTILIGLAAVIEAGWAVALLMHKVHPTNPHTNTAIALLSGVVFAVAGLIFFLVALP